MYDDDDGKKMKLNGPNGPSKREKHTCLSIVDVESILLTTVDTSRWISYVHLPIIISENSINENNVQNIVIFGFSEFENVFMIGAI